jgi:hypothetical protein
MPPTQVRRQDGASYLYLGSTAAVSPVWRLVRVGSALSRPSSPQSRPDKRSSTLGPRGPRQRSGTVARLSPTLARMSTCSGDLLKGRLFLLFFFENFFWTHLSCLWNPVRVTWPGSPADSQRGCTGDPHGCRGRPALGQITGCRRAWGVGRASRGHMAVSSRIVGGIHRLAPLLAELTPSHRVNRRCFHSVATRVAVSL